MAVSADMRVFELNYPGILPEGITSDDPEVSRRATDISGLFIVLEGHLSTAAVGLAMFETALADIRAFHQQRDPAASQPESLAMLEAIGREDKKREDLGRNLTHAEKNEIYAQAQSEIYRAAWDAGYVPISYRHMAASINAHAVVYALDGIGLALRRLARLDKMPTGVSTARDDYKKALPELQLVRDSAHHVDNRAVGLDRNGNPVNAGMTALGPLSDNRLCYTGEDGQLHEQEISETPIHIAQKAIQKAIDSLDWYGPAKIAPS